MFIRYETFYKPNRLRNTPLNIENEPFSIFTDINKLHIIHIVKKPNKYCIHLASNSFSGSFIFVYGEITSYTTTLELCETKDKADYDTITKFINVDADLIR